MTENRGFYDDLAATYHLIYTDWPASVARQGAALHRLLTDALGPGPHDVLDSACGIGTQLIGLAGRGHRLTGTDASPAAVARARREVDARRLSAALMAADMRALPLPTARFDAIVCADNSLPHLLTAAEVGAALAQARRVLRPGGLLVVSTRDYDALRTTRPTSTKPQVSIGAITFQLWQWHSCGERYDLTHVQLLAGSDGSWTVRHRRASYWAISRAQLTGLLTASGFGDIRWHDPERSGFFQPLVTARRLSGCPTKAR
jgi:SAM-dependent methyltransferase